MTNGPFGALNADLTGAVVTPTGGSPANMADIAAAALTGGTPPDSVTIDVVSGKLAVSSSAVIPGPLADIGATSLYTGLPFFIAAMGQSNMCGRDDGGSKTVASGIYMANSFTTPTGIVQAAYGVAPLNLTYTQTVTTTPSLCVNNQAIAFANALRAFWAGTAQANRPIVIVWSCLGAQPISDWVPTSGSLWVDWLAALTTVNGSTLNSVSLSGFQFDHVIWDQGEGDSTSGGGAANTQALYLTAWTSFLAQMRALPQVRPTTTFSVTELGPWYNNVQQDRNDALRLMAQGLFDPFVTFTSGSDLVQSTENPPYHYDGNSLQVLGQRHFQAWLDGRIMGGYTNHGGLSGITGGSMVINDSVTLSGTINLAPDDMRSGTLFINATAGGTVNLPNLPYPGHCEILIWAQATVTVNSQSVIIVDDGANTNSAALPLPAGENFVLYHVVGFPSVPRYLITTVTPRVGATVASSRIISGTTTLTAKDLKLGSYQLSAATVSLPTSATDGSLTIFYTLTGGTSSLTATGGTAGVLDKVIQLNGNPLTTMTLVPGQIIMLMCLRQKWFVVSDTAVAAKITVNQAAAGTVTVPLGMGKATVIFGTVGGSGTLASAVVPTPTSPVDGQEVSFVALQAVTSLTYTGSTTVATSAPSSLTAGQKASITYSSVLTAWV